MRTYRNPADLLGLGHDAVMTRFLRAAGVCAAVTDGYASDHEAFLALADAMRLYEGHPRVEAVNAALRASTGLTAPLCPHTAQVHWDAWVARHWYGDDESGQPEPPAVCPHCHAIRPVGIRRAEVVVLPEPWRLAEPDDDLATWSARVLAAMPADGRRRTVVLPTAYRFTRPDAYHAGLAVRAASTGTASEAERQLLCTQALRVLGGSLRETGGRLILCGGEASEVLKLIAYLDAAGCRPRLVWLADAPEAAAPVSGVYTDVDTGLCIPPGATDATVARLLAAYAAVAPIGRAVILGD